jgi:hypothetical protein
MYAYFVVECRIRNIKIRKYQIQFCKIGVINSLHVEI